MEDSTLTGIVIVLILMLIGIIVLACVSEKAKNNNFIRNKLPKMGDLTQYDYSQIVAQIGAPNATNYINAGIVCTWQECETSGWTWGINNVFTITLVFDDNGRCLGISSQSYV